MAVSGKTCLVTGCSNGGVGAALATAFKDKGYHVFATARSPSKIPQTLHDAPNVTVLALDIGSSESITAALDVVTTATGGKLDVLVNNAGVGLNMPGLDTPVQEARKLFDINFFGTLEMAQKFSGLLVNSGGCIVNNSSVGGQSPLPFLSVYQASKAALTQWGEVLRLEMAPLGVRVLTLVTGGVGTKFLENQPTLTLPADSYYGGIKDIIADQSTDVPMGMDPGKYANSVVHQVEKKTTGKLWIGGGAGMVRLASWLFPQTALDRISLSLKPFTTELIEARTSNKRQ